MSEAYVQDLCRQLNDLGSLPGKSACVSTRSGKVQVDSSLTGLVWRKFINTENESRASTVQGTDALLSTVNDYVASTLKMPPIVRNVVVDKLVTTGKVLEHADNNTAKEKDDFYMNNNNNNNSNDKQSSVDTNQKSSSLASENVFELAQQRFFNECDAQTTAGLKSLAESTRNSCNGIVDLLSKRYNHDFEIVALLLDKLNFATLIETRIEDATTNNSSD